jgi:hypothetical protein
MAGKQDRAASGGEIVWRMPATRRCLLLIVLVGPVLALADVLRERGASGSVAIAVAAAALALVVWRILAVGIETRGDELIVTNPLSRQHIPQRDIRDIVAIEDRPPTWARSSSPWIGSRTARVFVVRTDGTMVVCRGLNPEWVPDAGERIARLQRWIGGSPVATMIPLSLRRPSSTMRHRH